MDGVPRERACALVEVNPVSGRRVWRPEVRQGYFPPQFARRDYGRLGWSDWIYVVEKWADAHFLITTKLGRYGDRGIRSVDSFEAVVRHFERTYDRHFDPEP